MGRTKGEEALIVFGGRKQGIKGDGGGFFSSRWIVMRLPSFLSITCGLESEGVTRWGLFLRRGVLFFKGSERIPQAESWMFYILPLISLSFPPHSFLDGWSRMRFRGTKMAGGGCCSVRRARLECCSGDDISIS